MGTASVTVAAFALFAAAAAGTATGPAPSSDRDDVIVGTAAPDRVAAGGGDDRVVAWGDGRRDTISCGSGSDLVNAERVDRVSSDCETVVRQLSRDRTDAPAAQHETQVEPDSEAAGRTVVAVFQTGRYRAGGAAAIGFATSADGGGTWREGLLPASPRYARQSDPVVAYDASHRVWLAASLGVEPDVRSGILVSRAPDGVRWESPLEAIAVEDPDAGLDKQWLTCDNGARSPFRGRCYLAYTDLRLGAIAVQASDDGGLTWSEPATGPSSARGAVGAYPVVRPNGDLVVLYTDVDSGIVVLHTADGAASLRRVHRFGPLRGHRLEGLRAPLLAAAGVDAGGRVMAVWAQCGHRTACDANDVVLAESPDGFSWSAPRPLPTAATGSAFVPTVAVEPGSGRLAVLYYAATGCPSCRVDTWLVESADGRSWAPPLRLSARSGRRAWMARTSLGAMLADYVSVTWVGARPLAVFALAEAPLADGRLRQAIFASSRLDSLRTPFGATLCRRGGALSECDARAQGAPICDISGD
ncbi:MAG TPA: sialidase family protein [Gaiellaceae bacterium]|nr:sialidase family protein [Gaiellaceae bacterium]